jgi:hypothetical protein
MGNTFLAFASLTALAGATFALPAPNAQHPAMPTFQVADGLGEVAFRPVDDWGVIPAAAKKTTKKSARAAPGKPVCQDSVAFSAVIKKLNAYLLSAGPDVGAMSMLIIFQDGSMGAVQVSADGKTVCIVAKFLGVQWNLPALDALRKELSPSANRDGRMQPYDRGQDTL